MFISARVARVRAAPLTVVVAGAVASLTVAVTVTRAGPIQGVTLPDGPLGLWRADNDGRGGWSVAALVAIAALTAAFVRLYLLTRSGAAGTRFVAGAAAVWTAPMLLVQPLLSLDAYSYLAQGHMAALGIDPYAGGPIVFGPGPLLDAVAPIWRTTPAPYGPLSLELLARLAEVAGTDQVQFVLLLRALAVAGVVAGVFAAARLARPEWRATTVALVAANPITILHGVGGAHLDVLVGALAAVVLLAVRRRIWWLAAAAAALAFAVKLPGLVLVGYVLLARFRSAELHRVPGTLAVLAVSVAVVVSSSAAVPNGWGWLSTLDTPGKVEHVYTVPSVLARLGHGVLDITVGGADFGQVLSWARLACAAAGALLIGAALLRGSEPGRPARRAGVLVGAALLVLALAAPVIHAWYLAWGLAVLAAGVGVAGQRWLVGLSVALSFSALPDPLVRWHNGNLTLTLAVLAGALAAAAWWLRDDDRPPASRASGRPRSPSSTV
ncbi:polyprenol phosphomannose-dependent alpha 1,6 mannosyltransferase MptB [Jiangella asiatica]|uniref:DUF2029 domain-containing protein n=1 Tax=Jiangella asiatica TaxID=2530372 RepID=A0A4R5CLE9_9ACTN|nr:polyprenol phosphomannose-dependent alpha 1,6 mannosyltransferase MptB [Jiangella asiatica]TDE00756.1 hypothetical protein E1269_24440 [Jiangella asiatica]